MSPKNIFVAVVFLASCAVSAQTQGIPPEMEGTWVLTEVIYKEERQPPLDPDLNLRWSFFANETARLYWDKKGIEGFCERFSSFTVVNEVFTDEVFAVNPKNISECGKDPDMVMGRKVETKLVLAPGEVLIDMQVGDEKITYVLTRPDRCDFKSAMVINGRNSNPISVNCGSVPEPL